MRCRAGLSDMHALSSQYVKKLEGVWTVDNSLKLLLFSPASCWLKRPGTTTVYQSHANSNVFIELENKCYINHVILHILQVSHYSHLKSENFPIWDIFLRMHHAGLSVSNLCSLCSLCTIESTSRHLKGLTKPDHDGYHSLGRSIYFRNYIICIYIYIYIYYKYRSIDNDNDDSNYQWKLRT